MDDNRFLFEIVLLLSVAIVAVLLFRRLRISPMLGYLAGGLLVGPSGLALIATDLYRSEAEAWVPNTDWVGSARRKRSQRPLAARACNRTTR